MKRQIETTNRKDEQRDRRSAYSNLKNDFVGEENVNRFQPNLKIKEYENSMTRNEYEIILLSIELGNGGFLEAYEQFP